VAVCYYEIDELLNEAIITGIPAVIVEGIDDISIYDEIARKVPFDVEVYAVENIDGFTEGCDQVISAIEELNTLSISTHKLSDHVLGVIDKDVRDYRLEIPEIEPLLVLNSYSIESHFVSKNIIANILNLSSKVNRELVNDELCELIMDEIAIKLSDLYYFSLESLRKSLDSEYIESFSYSFSVGRINDQMAKQEVLAKQNDLDTFAASYGLTPCLDTLKSITKGKWLIDVFASELVVSITGLKTKCREGSIDSCKSCIAQAYDKCLYRIKEGFTKKTIKSLALTNVEGVEFDYIVDRISDIKGAL
jgi:hypothetical protein